MKDTKIFGNSEEEIKEASEIIKNGGTVIFPTETVYGLGANAKDANAVKKIFEAKGRPSDNPLIVHIDDFSKIEKYVKKVTENAKKLAAAYWPGPLTLILEKKDIISDLVSAKLNTVGIRIPDNDIALSFLKHCDLPVAAPSANISGSPSPTMPKHVIEDMNGRVDAIICGGSCDFGVESTVVDCTGEIPVILRPGGITPDMIEKVCGKVIIDKGIDGVKDSTKPKSPGMKYKHYAPKAEVILVEGSSLEDIVDKMLELVIKNKSNTIILCSKETEDNFKNYNTMCIGSRNDPKTIAKNLFGSFRKCDEEGFDTIILEGIDKVGIGLAVMNRAIRASRK